MALAHWDDPILADPRRLSRVLMAGRLVVLLIALGLKEPRTSITGSSSKHQVGKKRAILQLRARRAPLPKDQAVGRGVSW